MSRQSGQPFRWPRSAFLTLCTLSLPLFASAEDANPIPEANSQASEDTEVIVVAATRGQHDLTTLPMSARPSKVAETKRRG